ncbi:sulfite oxidase heme-binding subunit YedZ [Chitinilyticum piscinae]|uniref:Protein-methionine-sulfoxide reductase heme-binding subunit MsrQ n=1 Tax=Chitinilyticum piscinae TaxID=2866724 RepID=A0A8J7FGC8_9NEIS|nr:protein-methionine-sulfoxide reductase heme-binding subunit MsrQ [Chitinilyticum piscinae]MBE9608605.1 sulfoxide reductase heme-binding subunit YedZ [Chitinilyticum piscinae]
MLPRWVKPLYFLLALLPLLRLVVLVLTGGAVNPVEFITHSTGTWALIGLLVTLALTPLRRLSGYAPLLRLRRMAGLFAFFYACLHVLTYFVLDQSFDLQLLWRDVLKRPFVTLGFVAFVLLLPLAVTSTDGWMRRLKRNWGRLHRLVYPAAILVVLHYLWLVKRDLTQPLVYGLLLAVLLGGRVYWWYRGMRS